MTYRVRLTEKNHKDTYEVLVNARSHERAYQLAVERHGGYRLPDAEITPLYAAEGEE